MVFTQGFSQTLPISNGRLEASTANTFDSWTSLSSGSSLAQFSIEMSGLVRGSTKALRADVQTLGELEYNVQTKSLHEFSVPDNSSLTVTFYAKSSSVSGTSLLKLCISDPTVGTSVFKSNEFVLTDQWTLYSHTFSIPTAVPSYRVSFRYLSANTTFFIDEVNVMPGLGIATQPEVRHQVVEGFGGGIKRRTETLASLPASVRAEVENLAYSELHINMIRFFIHHSLENNGNDNSDPYSFDINDFNWNYYDSSPHFVVNTLQNALSSSQVGIDYIIGNCNSAPGWMKINESHKRASSNEDVALNTLKPEMTEEFGEFIMAFLTGMKQKYGIDVTEVSLTNEPDFLNTYESMNLTAEKLTEVLPHVRGRLDNSTFSSVRILSPENARVSPSSTPVSNLTQVNSAATYITEMFQDAVTKAAVEVIGTHTYYDSNHDADWSALLAVADDKPIWVTESGNLKSIDLSMTDASNYIKWITRGFNEGGLTAYMTHLLFEEHIYPTPEEGDKEGSSALVLWDDSGVFLPKRYHAFKHFSNLTNKGYQRISHTFTTTPNLFVSSFIAPSDDEMVVHVFNDSNLTKTLSVNIPYEVSSLNRYTTNATTDYAFSTIDIQPDAQFVEVTLQPMEFSSFVYAFTDTLTKNDLDYDTTSIDFYPNPSSGMVYFTKPNVPLHVTIYSLEGKQVYEENLKTKMDINHLTQGVYFMRIKNEKAITTHKLIIN